MTKGDRKHTGSNNRAPLSLTPFLKEENAADRKERKPSSKEVDADFFVFLSLVSCHLGSLTIVSLLHILPPPQLAVRESRSDR